MQEQLSCCVERDKVAWTIDHPPNETSSDKHKNGLITMIKMDRAKWLNIWPKSGINRKVFLRNARPRMEIEDKMTSGLMHCKVYENWLGYCTGLITHADV